MKPEEFDPNAFERGRKYTVDLELAPHLPGVLLPIVGVRGRKPGKVLVAMAGVHGDEYEGVRAILDTYAALDPQEMSGDLLAVPVANPPAFWNCTRTSPVDDGNLAREFPGSLDRGATAALAYHLAHAIIVRGDFMLDLHSAGIKLLMPTMVGYDASDQESRDAARAFGAKVLWGHDQIAPGRTISFAKSQGIPWLYTEARGAGRIHAADLRFFREGIRNLMVHLSILPGQVAGSAVEHHLGGRGDLDASMTARSRGFFISQVELLQKVSAGEELGRIVGLHGEVAEIFRAPQEGLVAMMRALPVVQPGEALFLITAQMPES
jgi:predicted deacylase